MDEIVDATTKDKYAKKMIFILAGYEKDINRLMYSNPGLTSRFPQAVNFRSLTPDECVHLLTRDLKAQQLRLRANQKDLDLSALEDLPSSHREMLTEFFRRLSKQENWASARDVKEVTKAIFRNALKYAKDACVTITIEIVETELRKMLQERMSRQNVSIPLPTRPFIMQEPTSQHPPLFPGVNLAAARSTAAKSPSTEPESETPPHQAPPVVEEGKSIKKQGIRDAGVSEEVWDQLQRDREAEEQREQEYQDQLKAQRTAREEDREKIVKRLLEEEERRRKEEEARKKLEMYGMCPMGYHWVKQSGGYRCAGGSHYMADAALQQL